MTSMPRSYKLNRIQRLIKSKTLCSLILEDLLICKSCIEGKRTKMSFITKGVKVKECLKLVHMNACGPFIIHALGGYEYFITFTNDCSSYGYIYLMHGKFDAID